MEKLIEFTLLSLTSLFTMINPLGIIPVYISLTNKLDNKEAKRTALKAVVTAFIMLTVFALSGKFIFDFFQISVHSLKIVGGIIFFMTGFDMLQARFIRTKQSTEKTEEYVSDISITPLAIPMICGPGAITVSIVLMNEAQSFAEKGILIGVIFFLLLITFLFLISGRKILQFIGPNGNKVLMRIMGLIVMVIAVEFFVSGLKPIIQELISK